MTDNRMTAPGIPTQVISPAWLQRPSPEVAPDLVGCTLVRQFTSGLQLRGRIVETEAYAPGDPACHAYRRVTDRNRVMFEAGGVAYVYLIYGIYHCLNVVSDQSGVGSAVLIRALDLDSVPDWIPDTKRRKPHRIAAGPGLLCQALQINRSLNGITLQPPASPDPQDALWLESGQAAPLLVQTTRIGLTQGVDIPWRWYESEHRAVSRYE